MIMKKFIIIRPNVEKIKMEWIVNSMFQIYLSKGKRAIGINY